MVQKLLYNQTAAVMSTAVETLVDKVQARGFGITSMSINPAFDELLEVS